MAGHWDSLFEYKARVPKVLVIQNRRINRTYWAVLFIFCLCFISFWIAAGYLWELYNFVTVLTAHGNLQAQSLPPDPACATRRLGIKNVCIGKSEAIVEESARSTFFTTYVRQVVHEIDAETDANTTLTTKDKLTQAVEDASVTLFITGDRRLWVSRGRDREVSLDSGKITTDVEGMDTKFEPGKEITLKLTDIIRAASRAEEKRIAGNGVLGPELKMGGGEIGAQVHCEDGNGHIEPFCTLRFIWLSNKAQRQGMLTNDGEIFVRIYRGIRLTCLEGDAAIHGRINVGLLVDCVTSLIVLVGSLQHVMNFLFLHCLGHLSVLYRRAAQDEFSVHQYTADACAHSLVVAAAYAELTAFHSDGGMSLKCVTERFRKILEAEGETFSPEEVHRLAAFVQFNVCQRKGSVSNKQAGDPSHNLSADHIENKIKIGQFIEACSSNQGPNFHDMMKLFHKERPLGTLERFYMPKNLRLFVFGEGDEKFTEKIANVREEVESMNSLEDEKISNNMALDKLKKLSYHIPTWTPEQYKLIEQRVLEQSDKLYNSIERRLEYLETIVNDLLPTPARPVHDTHVSLGFEKSFPSKGKGKNGTKHDIRSSPSPRIEPPGMERRVEQYTEQFPQRSSMNGGAVRKSGGFDKLEDAGHMLEMQIASLERMAGRNLRNA